MSAPGEHGRAIRNQSHDSELPDFSDTPVPECKGNTNRVFSGMIFDRDPDRDLEIKNDD